MSSFKDLVEELQDALDLLSRAFKEQRSDYIGCNRNSTKELRGNENFFENAEDVFMDEEAKFVDEELAIKKADREQNELERCVVGPTHNRKLSTLQLPTFSGKYADWKPYKDLFQAIMKDATDITDVERFYYLKSSLTEDAAKTIKNLAVTEKNYKRAWDRLVSHYDKKRALLHSALSELFTISPLNKESSKALRDLFITVQRLDPNTSRDWQTGRASTTEPPSYEDLDSFLKTRVEALEFVEMPKATADQGLTGKSSGSSANSRSGTNQARVSAHTASSQPSRTDNQCTYCKHEHYIAACDSFRALEVGQGRAFVQRNKLCFNCLGRHLVRDCRSNKSCKRCQERHHSLLHMSNSGHICQYAHRKSWAWSLDTTGHGAKHRFGLSTYNGNNNIKAADKVDVIIGTDLFPMLIKGGLRKGSDSALIAQDVAPVSTVFTKEEQECEENFVTTHRRDEHGRYIVRLPFKGDAAKLGDSKLVPQRTLQRMKRRFAQQTQLSRMYENFMSEYTSLNHMIELSVSEEAAYEQFYLPDHGVLKQSGEKSKLRVVFNGSVKMDNGATLNDCLHDGSKLLLTEIFDIMLRWR
ncbi:hypothetical protein TKK_0006078 [Trichogramma kaykai]